VNGKKNKQRQVTGKNNRVKSALTGSKHLITCQPPSNSLNDHQNVQGENTMPNRASQGKCSYAYSRVFFSFQSSVQGANNRICSGWEQHWDRATPRYLCGI